ncbi:MAG: hypothetical protein ACI8SR_002203 [Oceanicoccus sp.]|jgi:hypothetical protein
MKKTLLSTAISVIALSTSFSAVASETEQFIADSKVNLNFRYRAEFVNQDDATNKDSALANTLRSRVTLETGSLKGFSALIEGDNVLHITDDFYDGENGNTDYDKVLDQETTQLNQVYLQYKGFDSTVKLGNQRINLDNQRHVGGVAFRQDEATFDAVSVTNNSIDNTTVFLAVANNRNSIKNENLEEDITLLNVKYAVTPELSTTGFYYDIQNQGGVEGSDGTTIGVRAEAKVSDINIEAEFAQQDQSSDAKPLYYHLSAATKVSQFTAKIGLEVLGSDDGKGAFATPLGTNHKFLGWSDTYITGNGADGIQDLYANLVTTVAGVKLVGQLHSFSADNGSDDYGNEFGFLAEKNINNYGVSLKVSQFNATDESGQVDVTKVWLTGTAKF